MKRFRILAMILCSLVLIAMLIGCARSESIFPNEDLEAAVRYSLGKPAGEEITVAELTNLTTLGFLTTFRKIADLTGLEYCTNLTELILSFNEISDISPISSLTKLTELGLFSNQISDISPLSSLTNLTELHLGYNQISDISPLSSLTNLTWLDLNANQISDISPLVENSGFSEGDTVYLSKNPLSTTSLNVHIPQLEARGVTVIY